MEKIIAVLKEIKINNIQIIIVALRCYYYFLGDVIMENKNIKNNQNKNENKNNQNKNENKNKSENKNKKEY